MTPDRYDDGRAMLLAGLRRNHDFADAPRTIRVQWRDFVAAAPVPGRVGFKEYGVNCGRDGDRFEYMCGVEVESFEALPESLGRMRIVPRRYAVFVHDRPLTELRATYMAIWNDWLPRSGLTAVHAPDFEVYDDRFDPKTGAGAIEIWLPIEPAR